MNKAISTWYWGRSRAVVPSQSMVESTIPILATHQHALDSLNEYGIAVFVIDEAEKDGDLKTQIMGVNLKLPEMTMTMITERMVWLNLEVG